jgi:hypothetical protein
MQCCYRYDSTAASGVEITQRTADGTWNVLQSSSTTAHKAGGYNVIQVSTSSVQTDIYALGILLQELLTGSATPGVSLPGSLGRIVRRCTQLSPRKRFRSVSDLRLALELLGFEPSAPAGVHGWRRFLPPGFRTCDSVACFFSLVAYVLMANACLTMRVEGSPAETTANRVAVSCISLGILLFSGNYLDVQRFFPLSKSQNPFLRLLGVLIVDALIFFLGLILLCFATVFLR